MSGLIKNNYDFFKNKIMGYKYIFTLNNNRSIIVRVDETNFAHLIGLKHCSFIDKASMSGQQFFNTFEEKKNYELYDFIDETKDQRNELNKEEIFFKEKNNNFIPIFNSLITDNEIKIRIYKTESSKDKFSTDYLYIKLFGNNISSYEYIGIVGENNTDYHRFNSIIFDNGEKKAESVELYIKKFERIKNIDFNEKKYNFIESKHTEKKRKKNNSKKKKYSLNKKDLNYINKNINKYILKKGPNGKANYILTDTNGYILEKYFEKVKDWQSKDEIINYINKLS